ncbi:MAG: sigma 54-interacting transcriptional regulator [Nitrospiraceae bacterium]
MQREFVDRKWWISAFIGLAAFIALFRYGEYRPVGSTRTLQANVPVVGATNQDIQELVHQGRFRDDLLYRINTVTLRLPHVTEDLSESARYGVSVG